MWRSRAAAAAVAAALFVGPLVALASVALGEPATPLRVPSSGFRIPDATTQLVVGIAESWSSQDVTIQRFERADGAWGPVGSSWRGRLGARGLAWGRGFNPVPDGAPMKVEDDQRSPAGVFRLPRAYGYDPAWAQRTKMPYTAVTSRDLFVGDPASPLYNTQVRLDHEPATAWERAQRMYLTNPAHRLQVFVAHNADPVVPRGGSAIFLHVWRRGGLANTAGCTSMSDTDIDTLVQWLDPASAPLYVLLPRDEYDALASRWDLPASSTSRPVARATTSTIAVADTIAADASDAIVPAP